MLFGAETDANTWAGLFGSMVNLGFAALVGWYLLTKAIPQMHSEFTRALSDQRASHEAREQRAQAQAKADMQAVLEHCERESQRREESQKAEGDMIRCALQDL